MNEWIERLVQRGFLSTLDLHFAEFLARAGDFSAPEPALAAAIASRYHRDGHVCVDLSRLPEDIISIDGAADARFPEPRQWMEALKSCPAVGGPGDYRPLILDGSRLYFQRYWVYEKKLADLLKARVSETLGERMGTDERRLQDGFARLFPQRETGETDRQKIAAFAALAGRFCVVSGGPGTGKTFTAARILALMLEQPAGRPLRIALAAPTGKAAARLQEAINDARDKLDCSEAVRRSIPGEALTLHRLLRTIPNSPYFRHNADNPLPFDAVIVDEASMVDLPLLSKLVQAMPCRARLILLGDKDQLASVEAGAVLGDICNTGGDSHNRGFSRRFREAFTRATGDGIEPGGDEGPPGGLNDCIVQLEKSYRFGAAGGIGAVSRAVNQGDGARALALMKEGREDMVWKKLPGPDALPRSLKEGILEGFAGYGRAASIPETFALFNRFRILCALREGPYGVRALNLLVERLLRKEGCIGRDGRWYTGRPVMITRNDYNLRLFNGDVGIVLPDPQDRGEARVFFPAATGGFRKLPPLRLPEHETVFAMTVHKSQGSEFDRVLFLLPDRDAPVLTRELVYTGLTRARQGVEIRGREEVFLNAVSRKIERASGLRDSLWT